MFQSWIVLQVKVKEEPKSDDDADEAAAVVTEDGDHADEDEDDKERTEDHAKLLEYGLDKKVADRLDDIYKTGEERFILLSKHCCAHGAVSHLLVGLGYH